MILRVLILGIILIGILYILSSNREGFQAGSSYTLPAPQSSARIISNFWSILNQQKIWSATPKTSLNRGGGSGSGSGSASGSGSGSGSKGTQELLNSVINPGPSDIFNVVFPNYISIYALAKYGMDPVAARYALLNNYDTLQEELTTAVQTPAEISAGSAFTMQPKENACEELNALALSIYGQIIRMQESLSDLSGVSIVTASLHDENKNFQQNSVCTNQGSSPSAACIKLASQDETLFPILHNYDAANLSLQTNGLTIQSMLNLVIQSYKGLGCTLTPVSGSGPTIASVFSQTYINDVGEINVQSLSEKLQEISPYYVSPNLIQYITRQLIAGGEFKSQLETTSDYINNMSKTTHAIVSLVNTLQPGQYYDESGSRGGILTCPAGYYCPPTSSTPIVCEVGYYCPPGTTELSDANKCPVNSYSPMGASDSSACNSSIPPGYYSLNGKATQCPEGHYCPGGNSQPVPCPSGTYNAFTGKTSSFGVCLPCPAGSYCCVKSGNTCTPSGVASPTACPKGSFNPDRNAISLSSCRLCPAGTSCPSIGISSPLPCPAGTFSPITGLTGECRKGPEGYYSPATGLTRLTAPPFILCPAGYYCPVGSGYRVNCPAGSYCDTVGLTAPKPCPAGRYGTSINSRNNQCDGPCPAGSFCPPGTITGGPCPAGSYCPLGTVNPVPCTVGHYCPEGSSTPLACPPGTYNNSTERYSLTQCLPCPSGKFCGSATSIPELCPIGTYCIGGNTHAGGSIPPTPCDAGYYCDTTGMNAPTPCPRGTYSTTISAISMTTCISCAPGLYSSSIGQKSCTGICQIGTYCPGSTQCYIYTPPQGGSGRAVSIPIGGSNPIQCPVGTYCDTTNMSVPKLCPVGTYSSSTGATSIATCQPCVPGTYCPTVGQGSSGPLCPVGTYCPGGGSSPLQCPIGMVCPNPGLGSAIGCPAGKYGSAVAGNTSCTDCPTGTYRSTPNGIGLSSCTICPAGTTCPSTGMTVATPCPAGTTNSVAGLTGACTPCSPGTYEPRTGVESPNCGYQCPAGTYGGTFGLTSALCSGPCYTGYTCAASSRDPYGNNTVSRFSAPITAACSSGYFCPRGNNTQSVQCPAGYYCPPATLYAGNAFPIMTPDGSYSLAGANAPILCPKGTYSNSSTKPVNSVTGFITPTIPLSGFVSGSSIVAQTGYQCQACPVGTTTPSTGATSISQCA